MSPRHTLVAALLGTLAFGAPAAHADVLIDNSPDAHGIPVDNNLGNSPTGAQGPAQTCGDEFSLNQNVDVTGGSIFSSNLAGDPGDVATLRIYQLVGGIAGPIVFEEQGQLTIDTVGTSIDPTTSRKTLTLAQPVTLPPGDYVFSLYGQFEIFQGTGDYDDDTFHWGNGSNPDLNLGTWTGLGDAFFQLHGDFSDSAWSDQGFALAGLLGDPVLVGLGDLSAGSANVISLSNANPGALSGIFVGFAGGAVPFKGGTLVPSPVADPIMLNVGPTGSPALPFIMPAGMPAGSEIWVQWAIQDAAAVKGASLSNAIRGITP
jgi:hypothetical protein